MNLSLIFPYYGNRRMLDYQLAVWRAYPDDLLSRLEIIVVDDGSAAGLRAEEVLISAVLPACDFKALRIIVDVAWNVGGARNLGVTHSANEWVLFTDMDHVVTAAALTRIFELPLDERSVYTFIRCDHVSRKPLSPHMETKLMTRTAYWLVGGHDESLTGVYAQCDREFRRRVMSSMELINTGIALEHVADEHVSDASTRSLPRDATSSVALADWELIKAWTKSSHYRGRQTLRLPWAFTLTRSRSENLKAA